ncbi:MAG: hypothetical protein NTY34_02405 [Candidatus Omnitrophica bacterium]|nr:hypothetical protein [Candidatus Omnitrophota bacterium]
MLSSEEKREMLEDAKNKRRGEDFITAKEKNPAAVSFDIYISFLDSMQKIFSPFKITSSRSITKLNKL